MRKIAVIDIDDTLADLRNPMCNSLNMVCEEKYHWEQWTGDNTVENLYDISTDQLLSAIEDDSLLENLIPPPEYRDWETDRKSTRLNSSHSGESRMPSSA